MLDLAPVAPREHRRAQPRDERRLMRVTSGRRWRAMAGDGRASEARDECCAEVLTMRRHRVVAALLWTRRAGEMALVWSRISGTAVCLGD